MRRILVVILALFAIYVIINAWVFRRMDGYLYRQAYPDTTLSIPHRKISINSRKDKIDGIVMGKRTSSDEENWIIFCHSTENTMYAAQHVVRYNTWRDLGLNILTFDYIGTGKTKGRPSELGCIESATTAMHYLLNVEQVPQEDIIIYGEGMGVPIALELGLKASFSKIILENGVSSLSDHFRQTYPMLLFNIFFADRFDNDAIKSMSQPKLFLYSDNNKDISKEQTFDLYENAPPPKDIAKLDGTRHGAIRKDYDNYFQSLKSFIE